MKIISLAALLLFACASANGSRYSFDYTTHGTDAVGIERVFDDGTNTVLAFGIPFREQDARPTVTTAEGTVLPFRITGRYLVLPGLQRHVLIYTRGLAAQVRHGRSQETHFKPLTTDIVVSELPAAPSGPGTSNALTLETAPSVISQPRALSTTDSAVPTLAVDDHAVTADLATSHDAEAASKPPVAPTPAPLEWEAPFAGTLYETTTQWARRAGWNVRWELTNNADYAVDAGTHTGDFLEALQKLYAPYTAGQNPLRVQAYSRQKVIVISE